jgi:hypothetical protein
MPSAAIVRPRLVKVLRASGALAGRSCFDELR